MFSSFRRPARPRRSCAHPSSALPRAIRAEALESRVYLSTNSLLNPNSLPHPAAPVGAVANTPPTLAQAIVVNNNLAITGKSATLTVLGKDNAGESLLKYTWAITAAPTGGAATFSINGTNAAKKDTVTFTKAGSYNITVKITDTGGLFTTSTKTVNVVSVLTTMAVTDPNNQVVKSGTTVQVVGKSQGLIVTGSDQFNTVMAVQPAFKWSTVSLPSGAPAPGIVASGKNVTFNFAKVGSYGVAVKATSSTNVALTSTATLVVASQPTSITVTQVGGTAPVTGTTAQFTVSKIYDQFNTLSPAATTVSWTAASLPAGAASPTFAVTSTSTTVTFQSAGLYSLTATARDSSNRSVSKTVDVNVTQTLTGVSAYSATPVDVSENSLALSPPSFLDQFGKSMVIPPALSWTTTASPAGAPAPDFASSSGVTTATFGMAGNYTFLGKATSKPSLAFQINVAVSQTWTSIAVTPGDTSVVQGATRQFIAEARDQFGNALTVQPTFTWSASDGTIDANGLFTAPATSGTVTITADSSPLTGSTTVNVISSSSWLQNGALDALVQSLSIDGTINRLDMIQILQSTGIDGVVDSVEFGDLQTILSQGSTLNIPGYVQVLAGDVVNGNVANATYQGQVLGNLAAGSSATQLNNLVGKWFLGTDHPTVTNPSYVYNAAAGALFATSPSHLDTKQGTIGDCYFISALATIADSNPQAIQNMFLDNGDGTYTIRFYTGDYGYSYNASTGGWSDGFTNGIGTADYVTVDKLLATTSSGTLVYSGYGASYTNASLPLWIPLAEKAYAQWNETGNEGRDGTNTYTGIEGGWMATVNAQVLGSNSSDYSMASNQKQTAINALAAQMAVTIGTQSSFATSYGLVPSHAYAIVGYNASTDTFTLHNPWGMSHPGPLTWAQLQATCSMFVVADTSGSTPISSELQEPAPIESDGDALPPIAALAGDSTTPPVVDPVQTASNHLGIAPNSTGGVADTPETSLSEDSDTATQVAAATGADVATTENLDAVFILDGAEFATNDFDSEV